LVVARRELHPGDALPTVRQLAADLGINLNTVSRAYRALEAHGLVTTVRGRGTTVRADLDRARASDPGVRSALGRRLHVVLSDALLAGMTRGDVGALLGNELHRLWPEE
jgi:DNA-binding transcriptional regulator YhcF (GntR family)